MFFKLFHQLPANILTFYIYFTRNKLNNFINYARWQETGVHRGNPPV